MAIYKHPSTQARLQTLAERFTSLQTAHRIACADMWAGVLARSFTDEELEVLKDYISPNDVRALRRVRQPVKLA